jgi:hypothetical protein
MTEKRNKIRLAPIMKIPGIGNVAYVHIPHPARTYPADGDDLRKFLWTPPKNWFRIFAAAVLTSLWGFASWWFFTCVNGCLDIYIWALSTGCVVWWVRWLLDG